jgi:hypothetical protein
MHRVWSFVAGFAVGAAAVLAVAWMSGGRPDGVAAADGRRTGGGRGGLIRETTPGEAIGSREAGAAARAEDGKDGGREGGAPAGAADDGATDDGAAAGEADGGQTTVPPADIKKSKFANGVDQLIIMAVPSTPGASVPPLPVVSDEALAEELISALTQPLEVEEDDDAQTLERKEQVAQGRLEIGEAVERGEMTVSEYVNALREQANDNAEFLGEAQKVHNEIFNDEEVSDEQYEAARDQINEKLRERGLPEIDAREE